MRIIGFIIKYIFIIYLLFDVLDIERVSRPLVGFGVLIDNTIKGLTYLYEIMSRDLICGMI